MARPMTARLTPSMTTIAPPTASAMDKRAPRVAMALESTGPRLHAEQGIATDPAQ
jgi:hypothetical protein